jgi:hypothetical protein
MQYKPFPPEKRAYILHKPFEEFEQFFQELSLTERNRLASRLPPLPGGSFRPGNPQRLKVQLQRLWSDAKNSESSHNIAAWNVLEGIWQAWIVSHPELHTLLEHYNNSDDFQDNEPQPSNTQLDKEKIVDSYIELSKDSKEIANSKKILSAFQASRQTPRRVGTVGACRTSLPIS